MGLAIIFVFVTILSLAGFIREFKKRNFFSGGFAFTTFAVFGWFTVMTLYSSFATSGGGGGH